jgi:hypothetical protein
MLCYWHRMQNMTPACTIDERFKRPWQPLKGISIKKIYVPELSYPTPKKYTIFLKGLPNKKCSCMRCHWHRMHDFYVRKSIISRRIWSRIQKGFSPWIRSPGGIWWKTTEGRKSRDTVPLKISIAEFNLEQSCGAGYFFIKFLKGGKLKPERITSRIIFPSQSRNRCRIKMVRLHNL